MKEAREGLPSVVQLVLRKYECSNVGHHDPVLADALEALRAFAVRTGVVEEAAAHTDGTTPAWKQTVTRALERVDDQVAAVEPYPNDAPTACAICSGALPTDGGNSLVGDDHRTTRYCSRACAQRAWARKQQAKGERVWLIRHKSGTFMHWADTKRPTGCAADQEIVSAQLEDPRMNNPLPALENEAAVKSLLDYARFRAKRHTIELCLAVCKKIEEGFAAKTRRRETTPAHWERNGAQQCIDAIKDLADDLADEVAASSVVDVACPSATCTDCEVLRRQVGIAQAIADEKHGKLVAAQEQLLRIDRANEKRGNTPKST